MRSEPIGKLVGLSVGILLCALPPAGKAAEDAPARTPSSAVCAEQNVSVQFPEMAGAMAKADGDWEAVREAKRWFCSLLDLNPDFGSSAQRAEHFDNFGAGVVREYLDRRAGIGIRELGIATIGVQFHDARCHGDGQALFPKAKAAAIGLAAKLVAWAEKASEMDPASHIYSGRVWAAEKDFKVSDNFAGLVYFDFCLAALEFARGSDAMMKKLDDESSTVLARYIRSNIYSAPPARLDALGAIRETGPWSESSGRR